MKMQRSDEAPGAFPDGQDRRRCLRYRFTGPMTIRRERGSVMPALSVEISEGGMSAMASGLLSVGEKVELDPVAGGTAPAIVRHKLGELYGFEFVGLSVDQAQRIVNKCRKFRMRLAGAPD